MVLGIVAIAGLVMILRKPGPPKPQSHPVQVDTTQPSIGQQLPAGSPSPLDLGTLPSPSPENTPQPDRSKHPERTQPLDQQNPTDTSGVNATGPGPVVAQPTPDISPKVVATPTKPATTTVSGTGSGSSKPKSKPNDTAENQTENKKGKGVGGFFKKLGGILKGDKNDKKQ